MSYDSEAWDWGRGFCRKHRGQGVPCQTCIEQNDADLQIIGPQPEATTSGGGTEAAGLKSVAKGMMDLVEYKWESLPPGTKVTMPDGSVGFRVPCEQTVEYLRQLQSVEAKRRENEYFNIRLGEPYKPEYTKETLNRLLNPSVDGKPYPGIIGPRMDENPCGEIYLDESGPLRTSGERISALNAKIEELYKAEKAAGTTEKTREEWMQLWNKANFQPQAKSAWFGDYRRYFKSQEGKSGRFGSAYDLTDPTPGPDGMVTPTLISEWTGKPYKLSPMPLAEWHRIKADPFVNKDYDHAWSQSPSFVIQDEIIAVPMKARSTTMSDDYCNLCRIYERSKVTFVCEVDEEKLFAAYGVSHPDVAKAVTVSGSIHLFDLNGTLLGVEKL